MGGLTEEQIQELGERLRLRRAELTEDIREEMLRSDEESYVALAGQVHDAGESSVADLLSDVNLHTVEQDIRELREVEDALQRMDLDTYGVCEECGAPIGFERLKAYPTARRCLEDQARHERLYAEGKGPSL